MLSVFGDMSEWVITLFDNLLVLCDSLEDGIGKLEKLLQRCDERGVVLKFAKKSWIGVQEVKFFGYKVTATQGEEVDSQGCQNADWD